MAKKVKNTKLKSSKVKVSKIKNDNEVLKFLKLIIVVSLVAVIFYVITLFVNKKEEQPTQEQTKTPETIQYDYILAGNILNQPNDSYYVLVTVSDDINNKVYEAHLDNYKKMEDALRVYYVDLSHPMNSKFLKEESNFDIDEITEISFKESTLLLIKNDKIKRTYEGKDKIIDKLTRLTKTDE